MPYPPESTELMATFSFNALPTSTRWHFWKAVAFIWPSSSDEAIAGVNFTAPAEIVDAHGQHELRRARGDRRCSWPQPPAPPEIIEIVEAHGQHELHRARGVVELPDACMSCAAPAEVIDAHGQHELHRVHFRISSMLMAGMNFTSPRPRGSSMPMASMNFTARTSGYR